MMIGAEWKRSALQKIRRVPNSGGVKAVYNWCKSQSHLFNTSFKLIVLGAYGVNTAWCQSGV